MAVDNVAGCTGDSIGVLCLQHPPQAAVGNPGELPRHEHCCSESPALCDRMLVSFSGQSHPAEDCHRLQLAAWLSMDPAEAAQHAYFGG